MNKLELHPLLTEDENGINQNQHYNEDETPGIIMLENKYTVEEMIAFCRINVDKYIIRTPYKNQSDSDKHKINKYNEYKQVLLELLSKSQTLKTISVSEAFKLLEMKWRY